ncbi:hypothetical protein IAU60_004186 [Kwoniella sp. DSM 27419]
MSHPYPHSDGLQPSQPHDPHNQRPTLRGRPTAIQLPQNPYGPQYDPNQHPHLQYPRSPHQTPGVGAYYHPPPPPNIYYAGDHQPPGPPVNMNFQGATPSSGPPRLNSAMPSVLMPPQHAMPAGYGSEPHTQQQHISPPIIVSPYEATSGMPMGSGSSHNPAMGEYFPPLHTPGLGSGSSNPGNMTDYFATPTMGGPSQSTGLSAQPMPLVSPTGNWQSNIPQPNPHGRSNNAPGGKEKGHGSKTTRQQFTACGACRHRRVKCDLKDKQEAAEKLAEDDVERGLGPARNKGGKSKKVSCTNCTERGLNCIDEFAPLKAAKQLRRGKRISEIEMLFGKSAANAAMVHQHGEGSDDSSLSPSKGKDKEEGIPDLAKDFFESAFFRRFQVQRPIIDPGNFIERYLSSPTPTAAAMGPEGSVLCHVLYAWAVSYGVDEYGRLDVTEGGGAPIDDLDLIMPCEGEMIREADRTRRKERMRHVVEIILQEIDQYGLLRKPTWDGVRVLLMVLPLTDGIASPVERLSMYEGAISQVFTLCSFTAMGYDGQPSATAGVNGGTDLDNGQDLVWVRVRVYWYAFVHEGITTGLKGGRLHLDDEDLETMQDSISHRALVRDSTAFRISSQFATAPINLALACRKINKALTGPAAKRRTAVNDSLVKEAWEALERCWEEFDQIKYNASASPSFAQGDEVIRFADGWKIFLFEAQNVIRTNLEDRLAKLAQAQTTAFITESNPSTPEAMHNDMIRVQHLLDIAKSKCDVKTRQIMEIIRHHVGTRFFEWDASLVRDGTYYTAILLARAGGSDEDIKICIRALNELRWAHAKAWERSAELRRDWQERVPTVPSTGAPQDWDTILSDLARLSSDNQRDGHSGPSSTPHSQPRSSASSSRSQNHHHGQVQIVRQQGQQPQPQLHHQPPQPPPQSQPQHTQHQPVQQPRHISTTYLDVRSGEPTPTNETPYTSPIVSTQSFNHSAQMGLIRGYAPNSVTSSPHDPMRHTVPSQLDTVPEMDGDMMIDTKPDLGLDGSYPKWMEPRQHQLQNHQHSPGMPDGHGHGHGHGHSPALGHMPMHVQHHIPAGYPIYANQQHLGPPPLNSHMMVDGGDSQGSYVLQQDGSHVFVPYRTM